MISVIGVGTAGINIAEKFEEYPQYKIYKVGDVTGNNENEHPWVPENTEPESIEENTPDLKQFFSEVNEEIYFIIAGDSLLANATLSLLKQVRDNKISVFFLYPEVNLLTSKKKLQNRAIFNVLQEYTRSGLFTSLNIINNF